MMVNKLITIETYIAKRLKERRKALKMKQTYLARRLGISPQQISKYERKAEGISVSRLYQICKTLSVTPNYFYQGFEETSLHIEHDSLWVSFDPLLGEKIQIKVSDLYGKIEEIKLLKENK
ncbi:helix-turn-helix domain-containing protein [Candidatus Odyssella thessalonicensis]|uniref:helix-turn-helix domain-containing protein n=1 Tax=Candidatus Odyssella thessalonicensis TaxID=84647 RepID=UPI000225A9EC|nr:helix-turn-helix transcriptional regulator [Candidatus Odyssella thessalonicensis]